MARGHYKKKYRGDYDQNDGVPGVVYILRNNAFKESWLKIGCTRHSGQRRADEMNRDASTGIPAHHVCVFEYKTVDCGRAEKNVHASLSRYRKGQQEFFEVDFEIAKESIIFHCAQMNEAARNLIEERERADHLKRTQEEKNAAERRRLHDQKVKAAALARAIEENKAFFKEPERPVSAPPTVPRVDIVCPSCSANLSTPAENAITGQKFRCLACRSIFVYPPRHPTTNRAHVELTVPRPNSESIPRPNSLAPRYEKIRIENVYSISKSPYIWLSFILVSVAAVVIYSSHLLFPPTTPPSISLKNEQEMDVIMRDAIAAWPYLKTSAGVEATREMITVRDQLLAQGKTPQEALRAAIAQVAPLRSPKQSQPSASQ